MLETLSVDYKVTEKEEEGTWNRIGGKRGGDRKGKKGMYGRK